jgi:hypothetical protein
MDSREDRVKTKKSTVKEDKVLRLFRKEVERWIDAFGLGDWRVDVSITKRDENDDPNAVAYCTYLYEGRAAMIGLFDDCVDDDDAVMKAAFHEVCELLLAEMSYHAYNRSFNEDVFISARHGVIRRLERILLK